MAPKRIVMTEQGLTVCPSCMNHIELSTEALSEVTCPFCGEGLVSARRSDGDIFGKGVASALKSSRSTALAAMLGASLSMTACDLGEPEPEPDMGEADMPMNQALYGVPAVDMDEEQPDMPVDQPVYGAPATDMDDEADLEPPAPAYGLPPQDMG